MEVVCGLIRFKHRPLTDCYPGEGKLLLSNHKPVSRKVRSLPPMLGVEEVEGKSEAGGVLR